MKDARDFMSSVTVKNFISHMVQMKGSISLLLLCVISSLYPTWFRWKRCFRFRKQDVLKLYIPHGSDERHQQLVHYGLSLYFISHMVQMKVSNGKHEHILVRFFISHMVQMKGNNKYRGHTAKWQLYIPHGSDERDMSESGMRLFIIPLYPTWFRWKGLSFFHACKAFFSLYPTWFRWKDCG